MVKIDYYQEYIDLWTTDLAAATAADSAVVPGLLTAKNDAITLKTTNFGLRETLMTSSSAAVGAGAFDSYAAYKAASYGATEYAAYKVHEDAYLADLV